MAAAASMAAAMAMPGQGDAIVKCEADRGGDPGGTPGAAVGTAAAEAAADGDAAVVLGAGGVAVGGGASGAALGGPAGGSVLGGGGGGGVDSTPSGVHHSILSPTGGLLSPSMMFPLYVPPGAPRALAHVNAATLALGGGKRV